MKGLVLQDQTVNNTKVGHQVVRANPNDTVNDAEYLAENGLGTIVPRHENYAQEAQLFPENFNDRIPVVINPQSARQLDPIVAGEFSSVGKPPGHERAYATRFLSFALSDWLSVDGWPPENGYVGKWIRTNLIRTPRGAQTALIDRINIDRQDSDPYGNIYSVLGISPVGVSDLYQ